MRDHKTLLAWQRARQVVRALIRFSRTHWRPYVSAHFAQVNRAALSTQLNIAEGYALGPGRRWEFHLSVAYGSALETTEVLELFLDESVLPEEEARALIVISRETQALTLRLLQRAREAR